jgi:hypothetical protein
MPVLWCDDDLANHTLEDILLSQTENRAWSKELRLGISDVVTSRLAKKISLEQYAVDRKRFNEDMAECRRRANVLAEVIRTRR